MPITNMKSSYKVKAILRMAGDGEDIGRKDHIHQVQEGPLTVLVPSTITLVRFSENEKLGILHGSFEMQNAGKQLVTFKVMCNKVCKVRVNPSHGLLPSCETINFKVCITARRTSLRKFRLDNIGIMILATSCGVQEGFNVSELPEFWKTLIMKNTSFVEVIRINNFILHDVSRCENQRCNCTLIEDTTTPNKSSSSPVNYHHAGGDSVSSSSICNTDSGSSHSCSDSSHYQTDSDAQGSDASGQGVTRRRKYKKALDRMKHLSGEIGKSRKKMRCWVAFYTLVVVFFLFYFIQRSFHGVDVAFKLSKK